MITGLKRKVEELTQTVEDAEYILPPRYLSQAKSSSVIILHPNQEFSGVGFFVSPSILITVAHNIVQYGKKARKIFAKIYDDTGTLIEVKLTMKRLCNKFDIAVLKYDKAHIHLTIGDVTIIGMKNFALASFTNALSQQLQEITSFTNDGFAVIPSSVFKVSTNHIVYSSVAFSGDSGGALLFTKNGEVVAMHLETVNEAAEELQLNKFTLKDVAKSVNSCVAGFSSGFLGLRLFSQEVQNIIFN